MNWGIIKDNDGFFRYSQRKTIKELNNEHSINAGNRATPMTIIVAADKPEEINFVSAPDSNSNIFIGKLPGIWDIALAGNMAFIAIEQVDESLLRKTLQFL